MKDIVPDPQSGSDARPGFAPFRVLRRTRETSEICSFHLEPENPQDWKPFVAGQHLAIALDCPGRPLATYTISSGPQQTGSYRITVKCEADGQGGSAYLHEKVAEGDRLMVSPPRGSFVLQGGDAPVLLLTGGVGVTPAVSMLHALKDQPHRPVVFLHAALDGDRHVLGEEVRAIAAAAPHVTTHVAYAAPTPEDHAAGRFEFEGLLDRAALRRILPLDAWQVYLCGPGAFMEAMRAALVSLGVPESRIRQEVFTPAARPAPAPAPAASPATDGPTVTFASGAAPLAWREGAGNLLDFVEDAGFAPDFSCRAGVCGTCACRLLEGEVTYDEPPLEDPGEDRILLCCARPKANVKLDL